jgi:hypothetical protein
MSLQDAMRDRRPGAPVEPSEFSRWKGSATSFGPVGRVLLTVAVLIGLVVGEPMTRGFILSAVGFDVPGQGFLLFYAAIAVPLCAWLIVMKIWKRVRVA